MLIDFIVFTVMFLQMWFPSLWLSTTKEREERILRLISHYYIKLMKLELLGLFINSVLFIEKMAELTVDLSTLANGEEVEEWYALSGITPIGEWGSIRLRTR